MKEFKKLAEKGSSNDPFTHGSTVTSKCGTGTKFLLRLIPVSVPVPIIVVLVPLCRNF